MGKAIVPVGTDSWGGAEKSLCINKIPHMPSE